MSLSKATLLSHTQTSARPETVQQRIRAVAAKIRERGDLPDATVHFQLDLIDQLLEFRFGAFLFLNQGLNGVWTDYMIEYPNRSDATPANDLERDMLERFPLILATQERARHFNAQIQLNIRDGASLASIPCGVMRDLLGRDYSAAPDVELVGIDLDPTSLKAAAEPASAMGLTDRCRLLKRDAWELGVHSAFDLIASNGLNIYEPDPARQVALYRSFSQALKPGGTLVTSFLTPPPGQAGHDWNMDAIDAEALTQSRLIFADIIGVGFQAYATPEQTAAQLAEAGLETERFIFDRARMFPTVVARKP